MSKADSIKARLRNVALRNDKPYEYVLTHYFIERVLYRISVSPYSHNFVLKGGLLLQAILEEKARATRDIDLLAQRVSNQEDDLLAMFREICSIKSDDGVVFELDSLEASPIAQGAAYQGISLTINAFLDRTKGRVHMDVGFGDVVTPNPMYMTYRALLDTTEIQLQAYSLESVISEKFQAMVDLAFANSRMKDFFDVAMLASTNNLDGDVLHQAIKSTFNRRETQMPAAPAIFTDRFGQDPDKQRQWSAFIQRTKITQSSFSETLSLIKDFLKPLYDAIRENLPWKREWNHSTLSWTTKE